MKTLSVFQKAALSRACHTMQITLCHHPSPATHAKLVDALSRRPDYQASFERDLIKWIQQIEDSNENNLHNYFYSHRQKKRLNIS